MSDDWQHSARQWAHIGHPLRPGAEDLRTVTDWLADSALRKPAPRVVVMGATPEYYGLPWPVDVRLTAVDKSPTMLRVVWPGDDKLCADWLALPLPDASADLILCDGGLAQLPWPQGQHALARETARVLRRGGLLILRCFTPPPVRESVATVLDDLKAGKIRSRNLARLRIWMALQESPERGVDYRESWRVLASAEPRVERLAELMDVDIDYLRKAISETDDRTYYFAHAADVHRTFCEAPGGFRLEEMRVPTYPFGAWCPTHVLRRN